MPKALSYIRNVLYSVIVALSFAVLGISAHFIAAAPGLFVNWEGLGMVSGILSVLCLLTFLIVGAIRKNATITSVGVELPTLVVLSILFLAEGVIMQNLSKRAFPVGCNSDFFFDEAEVQVCKEFMALQNLSFANFGIMIAFWFPLLVVVLIAVTQGQNILGQSMGDIAFSRPTEVQADVYTNGYMEDIGLKDATQQQQIQLQQLQLQQLQQQQAMLQQQYVQQGREQV